MDLQLFPDLDLSDYPIRALASTTFEVTNFQASTSSPSANISPPENDKIEFYSRIFLKEGSKKNPHVAVYFNPTKLDQAEVLARHTVAIVDVNGVRRMTRDFLFRYSKDVLGSEYSRHQLVSHEVINNAADTLLNEDGTLKILVETSILEVCPNKPSTIHHAQTAKSILNDYKTLYTTRQHADFRFIVKTKELPAHKVILAARSVVFSAMFEHDFEETRQNRAEIDDVDPEVFEEMLRFIYCGEVDCLGKWAPDLLVAAEKYQLEALKSTCSAYLCTTVTTESLGRLLQLATLYNASDLKEKCLDYFAKHAKEVVVTDDWSKLLSSEPEMLANLLVDFVLKI